MPTPRKPPALRAVEGERGHRTKAELARAAREPKPRPLAPDPPAWLDEVALAKWGELAGPLEELGVLTEIDGDVLAAYVDAYSRLLGADAHLTGEGWTVLGGNGREKLSPWVAIRNRALDDMRKWSAALGIGAAARTRLGVGPPEGGRDDPDGSRGLAEIIARNAQSRHK